VGVDHYLPAMQAALWHFLTDFVRKSIRPVKNLKEKDDVLAWLSVWSKVQIICIWFS